MASKPDNAPATVRIECLVNPDLHLGDGRALKGPTKEGTRTVKPGDVANTTPEIAQMLIDAGQAKETAADITIPDLDA